MKWLQCAYWHRIQTLTLEVSVVFEGGIFSSAVLNGGGEKLSFSPANGLDKTKHQQFQLIIFPNSKHSL